MPFDHPSGIGHRLPLLGFLIRPVHPVLQPHPTRPNQPGPLPGVCPALGFPHQVESFHHILNDLELVVHHRNVPEVVAHPVGDAHPLLIEDVEMPPLHRIDVDVTNYWGACARAFFWPQLPRFLHLQQEGLRACLKASPQNTPCLTERQQLCKGLFRCHRSASSSSRSAPRFTENREKTKRNTSEPLRFQFDFTLSPTPLPAIVINMYLK